MMPTPSKHGTSPTSYPESIIYVVYNDTAPGITDGRSDQAFRTMQTAVFTTACGPGPVDVHASGFHLTAHGSIQDFYAHLTLSPNALMPTHITRIDNLQPHITAADALTLLFNACGHTHSPYPITNVYQIENALIIGPNSHDGRGKLTTSLVLIWMNQALPVATRALLPLHTRRATSTSTTLTLPGLEEFLRRATPDTRSLPNPTGPSTTSLSAHHVSGLSANTDTYSRWLADPASTPWRRDLNLTGPPAPPPLAVRDRPGAAPHNTPPSPPINPPLPPYDTLATAALPTPSTDPFPLLATTAYAMPASDSAASLPALITTGPCPPGFKDSMTDIALIPTQALDASDQSESIVRYNRGVSPDLTRAAAGDIISAIQAQSRTMDKYALDALTRHVALKEATESRHAELQATSDARHTELRGITAKLQLDTAANAASIAEAKIYAEQGYARIGLQQDYNRKLDHLETELLQLDTEEDHIEEEERGIQYELQSPDLPPYNKGRLTYDLSASPNRRAKLTRRRADLTQRISALLLLSPDTPPPPSLPPPTRS